MVDVCGIQGVTVLLTDMKWVAQSLQCQELAPTASGILNGDRIVTAVIPEIFKPPVLPCACALARFVCMKRYVDHDVNVCGL